MFVKTESTERPLVIDKVSSPTTVYVRKDIIEVAETEEKPKHFEYLENAIPTAEWELYEGIIKGELNILEDAIIELAEIIGG